MLLQQLSEAEYLAPGTQDTCSGLPIPGIPHDRQMDFYVTKATTAALDFPSLAAKPNYHKIHMASGQTYIFSNTLSPLYLPF